MAKSKIWAPAHHQVRKRASLSDDDVNLAETWPLHTAATSLQGPQNPDHPGEAGALPQQPPTRAGSRKLEIGPAKSHRYGSPSPAHREGICASPTTKGNNPVAAGSPSQKKFIIGMFEGKKEIKCR